MPDFLGFSSRLARAAWLLLLVLPGAPSGVAQAEDRVTLRIAKPVDASRIKGTIIADYDAFLLMQVDASAAADLLKNPLVSRRDDFNSLQLNSGALWTSTPEAKLRAKARPEAFSGKRLHLVQFAGPVKPEWYASLKDAGVRVISYVPENAYLVYGEYQGIDKLHDLANSRGFVQWADNYEDDYKLQPGARKFRDQTAKVASVVGLRKPDAYTVQMVDDASANASTLTLVERLRQGPIRRDQRILGYRNLTVPLRAEDLQFLTAQPEVVSVEAWYEPKLSCERQDMIISGNLVSGGAYTLPSGPGYLGWLAAKGFTQAQFTTSGFVVDLSDSGVDNATSTPNHFGLYVGGSVANASRVVYNRLEGAANYNSTIQGCDGHGNLNAHIIAGYNDHDFTPQEDAAGYHFGLGVCPFVKVGSSVIFDPASFTDPSYRDLIAEAYRDKARISSNSWGDSSASYTVDSQIYDSLVRDAQQSGSTVPVAGNQEMTIVFAAGNDGSGSGSIGSPGNAKNVLAVGASENVQAFGGMDGSGISDDAANSAMDMADFSSRGPTTDGRVKPDLVAPGTHVSGGVYPDISKRLDPASGDTGKANACFNASGVSGGPNGSLYFPTTQQWFTASSGTSHACPAVAGACALLRQYFLNQSWNTPSPAMTKAFLMNSVRYMTGTGAGDTLPSNNQGMGLLDLGRAFDGKARLLRDQLPVDLFTASGQARTVTGTIADPAQPFRVTLAWTDAVGSSIAKAYCNDLDLTVMVGGVTYKGNVFSGATSTSGGSADIRNNVESVFLPAGATGAFAITVTASSINSIGVPNDTDALNQDFALVAYNAVETEASMVTIQSSRLTSENFTPANSAPDPGENVTYHFVFKNVGTLPVGDLVVSLANSGGVTGASGQLSLGALAVNGTAEGDFSFTVDPGTVCGTSITLTFAVRDGSTNIGTLAATYATCGPAIAGFAPMAGNAGTSVTITGVNLTGTTSVSFHGKSANTFHVQSSTQLTATVPSGFTSGPITVVTPNGTATSSASFKSCDIDASGATSVADMSVFSRTYGLRSGDAGYVEKADLDSDGVIDDADIALWLNAF